VLTGQLTELDREGPGGPALAVVDGSFTPFGEALLLAPGASAYERVGKPVIDRLVGALLLLLALPALAAVAVVVRVGMGRGVLFKQERVGLGGRRFLVYKFRTMTHDRRQRSQPFAVPDRRKTHKHARDPRLTALGRFLRKWSLDELPQLWNVMRGEMSLIGPRPELVSIVEHYETWQHARHRVKPGLTGLWQVTARGDGPMHESTHIDLAYAAQVSLRSDCRILLLTIPALLGRRPGL
jgi:lipopolysaccharide/colanic/teichoic acid biosynthesis glycosyltransferase